MNKDKEMDLLNGKKYNIITFGCQMNEHDSETIAGMLQEKGCVETMSRDDSDITIINICSVRENADKRFFGTLGQLKKLKEQGFGDLPVCVAKTQYSFSDDPAKLGAPRNFRISVRNLTVSAGAGFIVALTGDIMTMPGLSKVPSAEKIDVDSDGKITGLF